MSFEYSICEEGLQASPVVAKALSQQLTTYVQPLLTRLDALVDLREVANVSRNPACAVGMRATAITGCS